MVNKKSTVLWSHIFFAVPLAIAVNHKLYLYSAVIILMMVASFLYHIWPKPYWHFLDRSTALLLIASNFALFIKTTIFSLYFVAAIILAIVAFIFFFKAAKHEYYHYHGLWHLFSALITVFSLLGYLHYR